ncbi:MAG: hypothetical protein HC884_18955 [Chloroflexaceae bacterium]|nr:hypothetical protein [Chloroflexaceae bacterium]
MIVELVRTIDQQLEEANVLEQQRVEVKNIQATHGELDKVSGTTSKLKTRYQIICPRFFAEDIQIIQQRATSIMQEIETFCSDFEHNRRQVPTLLKIEKELQKTLKDIDARWKCYATEQIRSHTNTLNLVRALPEIARQEGEIHELLKQLRGFTENLPSSSAKRTDFDARLQQLKDRLATLQGLSPAVQEFLQRVQNGSATLGDLSDDILSWCRQVEPTSLWEGALEGVIALIERGSGYKDRIPAGCRTVVLRPAWYFLGGNPRNALPPLLRGWKRLPAFSCIMSRIATERRPTDEPLLQHRGAVQPERPLYAARGGAAPRSDPSD